MDAKHIKFFPSNVTGTLANNIRAYWKLDETTGTTIQDSTANGFGGSIFGNPTKASAGKLYYSFLFDGVDDYIDCYTAVGDVRWSSFTVAGWVKLVSSVNSNNGICGCWGNEPYWYLNFNESDYFRVRFSPYVGATPTILSDVPATIGEWYHFAAVFNRGGNMSLYINGVQQLATADISPYASTEVVSVNSFNLANIGSNLTGYHGHIMLDGVGIWLEALSQSKILELYNYNYGLDYPFI
jgi:hypothetical protein